MYKIQSNSLTVTIAAQGAELQSIVNTQTGLEYLWSGDPAFWPKKSPVLFPVVGGLHNNSYQYQGVTYQMGRHGFTREHVFEVTLQTADSIAFTLLPNAAITEAYPFAFAFTVIYTVTNNTLLVSYVVENTGEAVQYFSVGAHPAFKVPLVEGTNYEDYYLAFSTTENAPIYPIASNGLIENEGKPFLENTNQLPLTKPLFYNDALIFKNLASQSIAIKSSKTPHGLTLSYPDFPYMGIWAAKNANFVCIEPWCGLGDTVSTTGVLNEKEGINALQPTEVFERSWSVTVY